MTYPTLLDELDGCGGCGFEDAFGAHGDGYWEGSGLGGTTAEGGGLYGECSYAGMGSGDTTGHSTGAGGGVTGNGFGYVLGADLTMLDLTTASDAVESAIARQELT